VAQLGDVPIADADVRLAAQERSQQFRNLPARVLVVGVGVHDVVRARLQTRVDAGLECGGQPFVAAQAHHVFHAAGPRNLGGAVTRPVVDHKDFDHIHAGDALGKVRKRGRQRLRLVQARNLDD
jgi:hypothetical protein